MCNEHSKPEELIQETKKAASVCRTLIDAMRADGDVLRDRLELCVDLFDLFGLPG